MMFDAEQCRPTDLMASPKHTQVELESHPLYS